MRKKYIIYVAQPFESSSFNWGWVNSELSTLNKNKCFVFNPEKEEKNKTGFDLKIDINNTHEFFINKKYKELSKRMNLVWFGESEAPKDILKWMILKRKEKFNSKNMNKKLWGDFEAVIKSDFIIAKLPKGSLTVGTHDEILTAMLFKIPVYLIMPNMKNKSRADKSSVFNKTNYNKVVVSGGKWFWSTKDCIKFIKEKYKL